MGSYNKYDHKMISLFTSFNHKIVDLKEIVRITNVFHYAKKVKIVKVVNFVPKENVFQQFATNKVIVESATNVLLKRASLDVKIKKTVMMAKPVLMTIVLIHQVFICVIYIYF